MTDKVQKIRKEVERLRNLHQMKYQQIDTNDNMCLVECGKRNLCNELLSFIDSLQEEPTPKIFEDMLNAKTAAESLGISAEEHDKIVDLCLYGKEPEMVDIDDLPKEEPVSKELEEAMQHNAPNNIGIDDLLYWRNGFITGSKWQKEQLIKNAIFGEWFRCAVVLPSEYYADDIKKVKLIIVKED